MKQTFEFIFTGREVGSLGKFRKIKMQVIASSQKEAELKIYDKYEHVINLKLNP